MKELVNLIQSHLSIGKPEKRELQFLLESKDPIAFRIGKMGSLLTIKLTLKIK